MKSASGRLLGLMLAGCAPLALPSCVVKKHEPAPMVAIELGDSSLYTQEELKAAVLMIREKFASFAGDCELHSVRYAGDEANNKENLE